MSQNKTPLIRPLRQHGATLYTFPSASEDISLNINGSSHGVALSHYALLNFTKKNTKDFTTTDELIKSLQNYALNMETTLINQSTYNFQEPQTVSEAVFWQWVQKQGNGDFTINAVSDMTNVYREKNYAAGHADRLVQCFGSIDSGNSLSTEFGMFNEIYVNVPTSYGNGPVYFRKVTDNVNIREGVSYNKVNVLQTGIIEGRNQGDGYLADETAIYDTASTSSYTADKCFEIIKDIVTINSAINNTAVTSTVNITSYDDVNIDRNKQYNSEYNIQNPDNQCEFNFNAVLLYYSIYDLDDVQKQPVATNLFGIVFLDGSSSTDTYLIDPYTKKKSYSGSGSNDNSYFGNSFSFRVNIKTMSVYDNSDARIDDNTTTTSAYSNDFNDVISNLNKAIDVMNTNVQTTMAIQDKYMEIRSYYIESKQKMETIKTELEAYNGDLMNETKSNIIASIDKKFAEIEEELREELGIPTEASQTSSDGTETLGASSRKVSYIKKSIDTLKKSGVTYGKAGDSAVYSDTEQNGIRQIAADKVNIIAGAANINTQSYVGLTAKDFKFNFITEENKISSIMLSEILKKVNELGDSITASKEETADEEDTKETFLKSAASQETDLKQKLFSLGFIEITGILQPRAKKPETEGYYLKTNTQGLIQNCVYFDGTEYTETVKCQAGKMYSCDGLIYVFNGETCKLIGE